MSMHPTAAALCLMGYRLWQFEEGRKEFTCFITSWHTEAWGYWKGHPTRIRKPGWTSSPDFAEDRLRNPRYKEIDWSSIPDSVWDQCNLQDAVEVLENRLPF